MAEEVGTQKVINEHSTVGLLVTTDGSISDIPREEYEEAEERVVSELKSINKPFVVLLNCKFPDSPAAEVLATKMTAKYEAPVVPVNCLELTQNEIGEILSQILFEFPIKEVKIDLPGWITSLSKSHWLRSGIFEKIGTEAKILRRVRDINSFSSAVMQNENINNATVRIEICRKC